MYGNGHYKQKIEHYKVNALMVQVAVDSGFGATHMRETAKPSAQRKKLGCRLLGLDTQSRRCNAQPDSGILTSMSTKCTAPSITHRHKYIVIKYMHPFAQMFCTDSGMFGIDLTNHSFATKVQ